VAGPQHESLDDGEVVAVQLGRRPRSVVDVAARCHLGLPVVIAVPPHLDDGTPFPTRYWLTCPLAVLRVSRIESAGGVKAAEARVASDPDFAAAHAAAELRYATERDALISPTAPSHRPMGGVGGARAGVKCLHAHYADHAAGNANPVGAMTATDVEPLDCAMPCVVGSPSGAVENPDWREPRP
jgi:hypothetical protein